MVAAARGVRTGVAMPTISVMVPPKLLATQTLPEESMATSEGWLSVALVAGPPSPV